MKTGFGRVIHHTSLMVFLVMMQISCGQNSKEPEADADSEEGYVLAYASDQGGESMDLFLYRDASDTIQPLVSDSVSLYGPSWSPDGSQLLYSVQTGTNTDVFSISVDGKERRRLTNRPGYDGGASYSPDGRTIVFVSDRNELAEGPSGRDLWLMNPDGSNARSLTRNAMYEGAPRFSPDGNKVAFCRQIPTGEETLDGEIFIIDPDGQNEVRVTKVPGFDCLPDWSPDGEQLAFHGCREDGCQIFVAFPDGSEMRRITNDAFGGQWPRWSPDGEWIAYTSSRDEQTDIWLIRPDGSESRQLTTHPGRDEVAAWKPISKG